MFLFLALFTCTGRTLYFLLWPDITGESKNGDMECMPSTDDENSFTLNVFGNLPACLFLSAFSVNVFTFARIYHLVLQRQSRDRLNPKNNRQVDPVEKCRFRSVSVIMIILNLNCYVISIIGFFHISSALNLTSLISIAVTAFFVAMCFVCYAWLLYRGMERKFQAARSALQFRKGQQVGLPPYINPMKRLVIVSSVCLICFSVRSVVLPLTYSLSNGQFEWPTILVYFICAELLPLFLMLQIFDPSTTSASGDRGTAVRIFEGTSIYGISQQPSGATLPQSEYSVSNGLPEFYYPNSHSPSKQNRSLQQEEEVIDYTLLPDPPASLPNSQSFPSSSSFRNSINDSPARGKPSSHRYSQKNHNPNNYSHNTGRGPIVQIEHPSSDTFVESDHTRGRRETGERGGGIRDGPASQKLSTETATTKAGERDISHSTFTSDLLQVLAD